MFYLKPTKRKMMISLMPIMILVVYLAINTLSYALNIKYDSFLSLLGVWIYIIFMFLFKIIANFFNLKIRS
jgi:hypothetical protein